MRGWRGRSRGSPVPGRLPVHARPRAGPEGGGTLRRDEKEAVVAALTERLKDAPTIIAADYRGLTVTQLAELRGRLRAAETEFTVVKNTLARRAASATGREALLPYLQGPTALAWIDGDPAVAAKALNGFAGEHPDALSIKGGMLDGAELAGADVARLAKLPSREQLLGQLAGGIAAPLTGLAGTLNGLISGLARSLAAVQAQRSEAEPAPTA